MRVIAGKYRGKKLYSPSDDSVRPTTDRIKETVFNILQTFIPGAVVLDLFAGSGALGIESISRGAEEVVFVDKNRESIALINMNLNGIQGNYRVIPYDFLCALRSFGKKADVVFIDPPYGGELGVAAVNAVIDADLLSGEGIIAYEHCTDKIFTLSRPGYKTRTKAMGTVTVDFITRCNAAMVTGSFDPITKGHESVIDEAVKKYGEVIVACLINPDKKYYFTSEERLSIVNAAISGKQGVKAVFSEKTAVDTAKEYGAAVFVRGIRKEEDKAYEFAMRDYNKSFGIDTVFIENARFENTTSTITRKQIACGNFENVPDAAVQTVKEIIAEKERA